MTRIRELRFAVLDIPFKVAFRHASAERAATSSVWVESVSDGAVGRGESCPRPYLTGETIDSARAFFSQHEAALREHVVNLGSLRAWMDERREELDGNPAAWCAIELAIVQMLALESGVTIEGLLALPRLAGRFRYTAVLGDMSHEAFQATAGQYRRQGFTDVKVKLSASVDRDRGKIAVLCDWGASGSGWTPTTCGPRPTRRSRSCWRSTIRSMRWKSRSRRAGMPSWPASRPNWGAR
jgi:L-alanine-DL-glutamate epimerase-like enolase superfamily enzyme